MREDLISRRAALTLTDRLLNACEGNLGAYHELMAASLLDLPSAFQLLEDGTLIVTVPNLSAVHRIIVDEEKSRYCKTFYQDGDEEEDDKLAHNCYDCKHKDRMPGVYPCSYCAKAECDVQPSKWEPKEVDNEQGKKS